MHQQNPLYWKLPNIVSDLLMDKQLINILLPNTVQTIDPLIYSYGLMNAKSIQFVNYM